MGTCHGLFKNRYTVFFFFKYMFNCRWKLYKNESNHIFDNPNPVFKHHAQFLDVDENVQCNNRELLLLLLKH